MVRGWVSQCCETIYPCDGRSRERPAPFFYTDDLNCTGGALGRVKGLLSAANDKSAVRVVEFSRNKIIWSSNEYV